MKNVVIILLLLANIISASTYIIPSEKLGTSATNLVLGTSLFNEKSNALFNNDAKLNPSLNVQGFFTEIVENNQVIIGSITIPIKRFSIGIGYADQSIKGLRKTTKQGLSGQHFYTNQTYGYSNQQIKLSFSYLFDKKISIGSGINAYRSTIDSLKGTGYGIDIGFKYTLSKNAKIAMSVKNLAATDINYSSYKEEIPMSFELGIYSYITKRTHISLSAKRLTKKEDVDSDTLYNGGLIYKLTNQISLLGGVYQRDSITDNHLYYSGGIELNVFPLSIEYGYRKSSYKENENQHFFSVGVAI